MPTIERFEGFPAAAFGFYVGLEADNSRPYMDANRTVYERAVRLPMESLLAEVDDEFGDGKVFRPNRDVRFSKDKRPYKDHCGAVIHHERGGLFYCHVAADHLFAASGYYRMARDQLQRFYAAIDDERTGSELVWLADAARDDGLAIGGSQLKTSPRGYDNDHPRVELLRHKGMSVSRTWPVYKWTHTREALTRITAVWRAAGAINAWLDTHVGPERYTDHQRGA